MADLHERRACGFARAHAMLSIRAGRSRRPGPPPPAGFARTWVRKRVHIWRYLIHVLARPVNPPTLRRRSAHPRSPRRPSPASRAPEVSHSTDRPTATAQTAESAQPRMESRYTVKAIAEQATATIQKRRMILVSDQALSSKWW